MAFLALHDLALAAKHGFASALQVIPWIGNSDGLVTWQAIVERTVQVTGMILVAVAVLYGRGSMQVQYSGGSIDLAAFLLRSFGRSSTSP